MKRKFAAAALLILAVMALGFAQGDKPRAADAVLKTGIEAARASGRTVFLIFHASWCGWCKKLDKALEDPALKTIVDESFVVAHLDVMESAKDKIEALENPGGRDMLVNLGGEKAGLPFYIFLDGTGKKIADSNALPGNANIGYPSTPEEIGAFETLLKATAKKMSEPQRAAVMDFIRKNK
jgi:thioredoxin-related protein